MTPLNVGLKKIVAASEPFLGASLDAACVVGELCQVVQANLAMKKILGLKPKELVSSKTFCEFIELEICKDGCKLENAIKSGKEFRFDDIPAVLKGQKLRVSIKAVPLFDGTDKNAKIVGALVTLRETTGEILVQAKYHKLLEVIKEKDEEIEMLRERMIVMRKR